MTTNLKRTKVSVDLMGAPKALVTGWALPEVPGLALTAEYESAKPGGRRRVALYRVTHTDSGSMLPPMTTTCENLRHGEDMLRRLGGTGIDWTQSKEWLESELFRDPRWQALVNAIHTERRAAYEEYCRQAGIEPGPARPATA